MSKKNRLLTYFFFLFNILTLPMCGQSKTDSLLQKHFSELYSLAMKQTDSAEIDFYGNILVKKGDLMLKEGKDLAGKIAICIGYKQLGNNRYLHEESLAYADSIIMSIGDKVIQDYPTVAYQLKGDYYYTQKSYQKALDNYLMVVSKAQEENSNVMIFRGKVSIADLKRLIGQTDEALRIHQENLKYLKTTSDYISPRELLATLSYLADIFNEQRKIDSAHFYNMYGVL